MENFKPYLGKPDFNIGDSVVLNLTKKDYLGKSLRRTIIEDKIRLWQDTISSNLWLDINYRYYFKSSKENIKAITQIYNKKRTCFKTIRKENPSSIDNLKSFVDVLNNITGAIVIGLTAHYLHTGHTSTSNVCYVRDKSDFNFYKYTVMLTGYSNGNHVQFLVDLLPSDISLFV